MEFDELRSRFDLVRKHFDKAETLEEKLRLLAVSQAIIREAQDKIVEFRRRFQMRINFLPYQ
jgi:hypothetical protein